MKVMADIFPASCVLADITYKGKFGDLQINDNELPQGVYRVTRARVVVFDNTVLIAVDAVSGPDLIFKEGYTRRISPANREGTHHVFTSSGKYLAFRRDDSCGCGSRLRRWNPYSNYTSSR